MLFWRTGVECPEFFRNDRYAAVVVGPKVYTFGGYNRNLNVSDQPIGVHVFNTMSLRWLTLPPVTTARGERPPEVPAMRRGHRAALLDDIAYIWGGKPYCNVLYAFDIDTHRWFTPQVYGAVPEARCDHSACVLGKVIYVYGGHTRLTGSTNDIYKMDTAAMVWSLINTGDTATPASSGHSATMVGTKMFVFGDRVGWAFDTETDCWTRKPSRKPSRNLRTGHSAFAHNGELYIIGGHRGNCNDLWKFNAETNSWKAVRTWRAWQMSSMCCCMVGDHVILVGGYDGYDVSDHLYILDLSPTLKTLCKTAVIRHGLDQSELPRDIQWELAGFGSHSKVEHHPSWRHRRYTEADIIQAGIIDGTQRLISSKLAS